MTQFNKNIDKTMIESIQDGVPVFVNSDALKISFQTKILRHDEVHIRLKNNVPIQYISDFIKGKNYTLQTGMQRFITTHIQSDGENMIFPINQKNIISETRSDQRTYFYEEDDVYCEIINPFDNLTVLKKSVLDLSNGGFGLSTRYESKLFSPSVTIDQCKIYVSGQLHIKCKAEVVYTKQYHSLKGYTSIQVGCKFLDKVVYD